MKSYIALALLLLACSSDDGATDAPPVTAGTGGSAGAQPGSGGAAGQAGVPGLGGAAGSAQEAGAGGSAGSGGEAAGQGGKVGSGGAPSAGAGGTGGGPAGMAGAGGAVCNPQPEVCNGKDDDCDGVADNGLSCGTGGAGGEQGGAGAGGDASGQGGDTQGGQAGTGGADAGAGGLGGDGGSGGSPTAGAGGQGGDPSCKTQPEICDGKDNNCNGQVDEGCDCTDGMSEACYSGAVGTEGVGVCNAGVKTCSGGQWSLCVGEVLPQPEDCKTPQDDDCDGSAPACPGEVTCAMSIGTDGEELLGLVSPDATSGVFLAASIGTDATAIHLDKNCKEKSSYTVFLNGVQTVAAVASLSSGDAIIGGQEQSSNTAFSKGDPMAPPYGYTALFSDVGGGILWKFTTCGKGVTGLVGVGNSFALATCDGPSGSGMLSNIDSLGGGGGVQFCQSATGCSLRGIARSGASAVVVGVASGQASIGGIGADMGSGGIFLATVNPSGSIASATAAKIVGSAIPQSVRIATGKDGGIYLAGTIFSPIDLGGGMLSPPPGKHAVFLAKFDNQMAHVWSKIVGVGTFGAVAVGADGSLVVGGDMSTVNGIDAASPTASDATLVRLSPTGETIWAREIGGNGNDLITSLAVAQDGSIFVSGASDSTSGMLVGALPNAGKHDVFVARFAPLRDPDLSGTASPGHRQVHCGPGRVDGVTCDNRVGHRADARAGADRGLDARE